MPPLLLSKYEFLLKISSALQLAALRGSRNITTDDVIFMIRHNHEKVSRLKTFLSYKEAKKGVRKTQPCLDDQQDADTLNEAAEPGRQRKKIKFSWDIISHYCNVLDEEDDGSRNVYYDKALRDKEVRLKVHVCCHCLRQMHAFNVVDV